MKRLLFLVLAVVMAISLVACGGILVDTNTPKSAELSEQYAFYHDSVTKLRTDMRITPEQADEVFLVLISCGMDSRVSDVTNSEDDGHCAIHSGLDKFDVYYTGGVVDRVEKGGKELYPAQEKEEDAIELAPATDLDFITQAGHPTYYGSVEDSHSFWKDVEKGKIHFADSFDDGGSSTILSMWAYRNSDVIRSIDISFDRFEEPPMLSIEEALPIIASYMPFEIMDEYYQFQSSELLVSDEGTGGGIYVISYCLTDEAKEGYSVNHEYAGSIDVQISIGEDGFVPGFHIGFGRPRWMYSLALNGWHSEEWRCDLYDYRQ